MHERAAHTHVRQNFAGDRTSGNPHRRFPRGLPASTAIIAHAILHVVRIVGMPRPIFVFDVGIILRSLIDVVDHERDGRTGSDLLPCLLVQKDAGQNPDRIWFLPLSREARLARTATIEVRLDIAFAERNARRTTVDHATDRGPVAFAEGRHPKQMPVRIERHDDGGEITADGCRKRLCHIVVNINSLHPTSWQFTRMRIGAKILNYLCFLGLLPDHSLPTAMSGASGCFMPTM